MSLPLVSFFSCLLPLLVCPVLLYVLRFLYVQYVTCYDALSIFASHLYVCRRRDSVLCWASVRQLVFFFPRWAARWPCCLSWAMVESFLVAPFRGLSGSIPL